MSLFEIVLYNNENIYNIYTYAYSWSRVSLTFSKLPLSLHSGPPQFVLCLLPKMTSSALIVHAELPHTTLCISSVSL